RAARRLGRTICQDGRRRRRHDDERGAAMIGRWRKKSEDAEVSSEPIVVEGYAKGAGGRARSRIRMTMLVFFTVYAVIGGRLVWLGNQELESTGPGPSRVTTSRPDIVDRNGEVLA